MLPIYLSIEGFYSYQNKQEIDFTELTQAGLFGIFGAVGSGKSSILEAISYALYGDTERLNRQEKRGYNMLNLQSKQARIVFDFLNFEGNKFRFTAQWKRRTSKFEETTSLERQAYQWIDGEWSPLESADGALVTQLSYPNFRRTMIIPQGKFKEFLELGGKDRSIMMKEIFQLEKFDLGPKTASLLQESNRKLEHLRGALSGYESISSTILQEKEQELQTAKEKLNLAKTALDDKQLRFENLTKAHERQVRLSEKKALLHTLYTQKESIIQRDKEISRYEKTVELFREPLSQAQRLNNERDVLTKTVENLSETRRDLSGQVEKLTETFSDVQGRYVKLDQLRTTAEDYRTLGTIQNNQSNLQKAEQNLEKGKPIITKAKAEGQALREKVNQAEQGLETLKQQRFDTRQLMEIETWYVTRDNMAGQLSQLSTQLENSKQEVEQLKKKYETYGYTWQDWPEKVARESEKLDHDAENLKNEQTHLRVQVKLGEFAQELRDNDPCPLCGALDHPHPMNAHEAIAELKLNEQKSQTVAHNINQLKNLEKELQLLTNTLNHKSAELDKLYAEHQGISKNAETHRQSFTWAEYSPEDKSLFDRQKELIQQHEEQVKSAELNLKTLRQQLDTKNEDLKKYELRFQELESQVSILNARIEQSKSQLHLLEFSPFAQRSTQELEQLRQDTLNNIQQIESDYVQIGSTLNDKKQALAGISGQLNIAKERFGIVREEVAAKQQLIASLLSKHQYADLYEVQRTLEQNLPVQTIRNEINQFYVQLQVLEQQVGELEDMASQDNFTVEELETAKQSFYDAKVDLEKQLSLTGGLEKELARLTIEHTKKEKLLEEYNRGENRVNNLKLLDNLFRGNGFVNYVSTIHMERLCEIANERFHRLTKNQLSLTINENNEFEVIDFLNNGYKRSVKTLSGGQAFQASLCLALALAENIQTRHKADKNFFFIDEGFGTQDADSINTVFNTLQYLHQENRIVGVISHVDELKERIPRSVTVIKDTERGSIVRLN